MNKIAVYVIGGIASSLVVTAGCYSVFRSKNDKRIDKFNFENKVNKTKAKVSDKVSKLADYLDRIYSRLDKKKTIVIEELNITAEEV